MAAKVPTKVFTFCVSISDLTYKSTKDGPFLPNPDLATLLEILYIKLNLCDLCEYYSDDVPVGKGDMMVFTSSWLAGTYFIADLYRELTGPLDNVTFYIQCPHLDLTEQIRACLRDFFDQADYQFSYTESCSSATVNSIMTKKNCEVWQIVKATHYPQKVIFHS